MKKFVVVLMLALFSIGVHAQTEKGRSSVGLNLGYSFNDIGNTAIGIDYRYSIIDAVRIAPSVNFLIKHKGVSSVMFDVNAHYVVKLSEMFGFYPLAGLSLSVWHGGGDNITRFGGNLGLGAELYATHNVTVGVEAKYNIIKDLDGAMVGVRVGYNF
ncbi:outer membrane beta-barrel protein [Parabacteroides sp. APC149_11_2_Y6]